MTNFYISYFYQIRNMKHNTLPVSTAMWDPKWFHERRIIKMNENLKKIEKKIKALKETKKDLLKVLDSSLDLDEDRDNDDLMNSIKDIINQINDLEDFINRRIKPAYRD